MALNLRPVTESKTRTRVIPEQELVERFGWKSTPACTITVLVTYHTHAQGETP